MIAFISVVFDVCTFSDNCMLKSPEMLSKPGIGAINYKEDYKKAPGWGLNSCSI
jgi:hypothetical protein